MAKIAKTLAEDLAKLDFPPPSPYSRVMCPDPNNYGRDISLSLSCAESVNVCVEEEWVRIRCGYCAVKVQGNEVQCLCCGAPL